jgi:Uma2 family endonuclease
MPVAATVRPAKWTAADLVRRFGPISLDRICFSPFPGTATEQDALDLHQRTDRLFELVDGVLVEKVMAFRESFLAIALSAILRSFVTPRNLGAVIGADGMMRLAPGLVRIPDISFIPWDRFPDRRIPDDPIADVAPDLAVEVLSPSNTKEEMKGKRRDYFAAGCRLVWEVDPVERIVTVYTSPNRSKVLRENQTLDGGAVLPGFALPLRQLFAELDPH